MTAHRARREDGGGDVRIFADHQVCDHALAEARAEIARLRTALAESEMRVTAADDVKASTVESALMWRRAADEERTARLAAEEALADERDARRDDRVEIRHALARADQSQEPFPAIPNH